MAARVIGGRYELLREIGRGGMGTVWEGRHVATSQRCAVKVIHEHAALGHDAMERFEREVRAPELIAHPGLVEVFDAFVDQEGRMVLVMELLVGVSLRDLLGEGAPLQDKLAVLLGALEPLAAAHRRGFVHRDMKPENVFVVADEAGGRRVKLLDFGVARQLGTGEITETGVIVGSARYISPEQAHSARRVGPSADVFSVGVMLYESASGEMPFGGESAFRTLANLAAGKYRPLDSVVAGLPADLVSLVHECIAFEPEDRPADAGALLERLAPIVEGSLPPISPRRSSADVETEWASRVRTAPPPPAVVASVPTPMRSARSGRRAKGTNLVPMIRTLEEALAKGEELPLSPEERERLAERVILSDWYPFEYFAWLAETVHRCVMDGSDAAAVRMGEVGAQQLLTGVHASFVHFGNVPKTLRTLPRQWSRYFDFGEAAVELPEPGGAVVRLRDYPFMPPLHELMLVGWVKAVIENAGGRLVWHELAEAPSRGGEEWVLRVEYEGGAGPASPF